MGDSFNSGSDLVNLLNVIGGSQRLFPENISSTEQDKQEVAKRAATVIRDLLRQESDLIYMFVTCTRLLESSNREEMIQAISEIVINIISSEDFGIYWNDGIGIKPLYTISSTEECCCLFPTIEDLTRITCGKKYFISATNVGRNDLPSVLIPFKHQEELKGYLLINSFCIQKTELTSLDFRIFDYLADHVAIALAKVE